MAKGTFLKNLTTEDPDQLVMCEFRVQNFDLVVDQVWNICH